MKALNLSRLKHEVWKDKRIKELGMRKYEIKIIIEVIIDHIIKGFIENGKLKMQGLFSLNLKKVKSRKIANPQTGEPMLTKEYYKIHLEPSNRLKAEMKNKK